MLYFALAPFPPGLGMVYLIRDTLRGHPQGSHGTQPQNLVGLWVREETLMYDFLGQAFYLMPDGKLAGTQGMTERRWHFDNERLYIDAVSRCGNCYRGNVTTKHTTQFVGADQLIVTNRLNAKKGIVGTYRRVEITDALKPEMSRLEQSKDEVESFKARSVLRAVEHFEMMSKPERWTSAPITRG